MTFKKPSWLDAEAYPFSPHFLELPAGKLHYVDEGKGEPILIVHGTPSWSFEYRELIKHFSKTSRVIAPDHIGFGLSDKPTGWTYRPRDHSENLLRLVEKLDLRNITLVVHDFGGPIGLGMAEQAPERIKRIVLMNTWLWDLSGVKSIAGPAKLFGGAFGRLMYKYFKFSVGVMMPASFADKSKLKPVYSQYKGPFLKPAERIATWVFAAELLKSGRWYQKLWEEREKLNGIPKLIGWGMQDKFLKPELLEIFKKGFPEAQVVEFQKAGHFVSEEAGKELIQAIEKFIVQT